METNYYLKRKVQLLDNLDEKIKSWQQILSNRYGDQFTQSLLQAVRERFEELIPEIPYIGGERNHLTWSLISSVQYLAFFQTMDDFGKPAGESGKVLYDAIETLEPAPPIPPAKRLSQQELMERRRKRAEWSQKREFKGDWIYEFVEGNGRDFDFGYNFTQCATDKFYRAQGAQAYMPYYCFLDFPICQRDGLGLHRTMTLSENHPVCNFRFKVGGKSACHWPPTFLER
jgi:hypothetical protein